MEQKMYNADDARADTRHAVSVQGEAARLETIRILELVKKAAKEGKTSLQIENLSTYDKESIVESRLKALGFSVKQYHGDQRDPGYYTISW